MNTDLSLIKRGKKTHKAHGMLDLIQSGLVQFQFLGDGVIST